jgi:GDPmannose 4,6-dehydratase
MISEMNSQKKALITGIVGQDGSYLAELLIKKNYEIHGLVTDGQMSDHRRRWRIKGVEQQIKLHVCELVEEAQVDQILAQIQPNEIYHLASNVDPKVVFEEEIATFDINFRATINLLRAIVKIKSDCKIYCAGSSMMFGDVQESPQSEKTPMNPTTPYGIAKVAAFHFVRMYREAYGVFACTGILYNHESPRRDARFLPRKISKAVAQIKSGRLDKLTLGDIEIKRDWSYAGDVVESMWLMLQAEQPNDYVIGSGELHSIRELLEIAFDYVGLDWRKFVVKDESLIRTIEYVNLCADPRMARADLHWQPKVKFRELIIDMVREDLNLAESMYD